MKDPLRYYIDEGLVTVTGTRFTKIGTTDVQYTGHIQPAFSNAVKWSCPTAGLLVIDGVGYEQTETFFKEYVRLFTSEEEANHARQTFVKVYEQNQYLFQQTINN